MPKEVKARNHTAVVNKSTVNSPILIFQGSKSFRMRIILSTLTSKPIQIQKIRSNKGGIKEFERNFLTLMDKITKGTKIEINALGDTVTYKPGVIIGSGIGSIVFDCGLERGIGYYLEGLISLCPFGKFPSSILLRGITNHPLDMSVDMFRNSTLHLFENFIKNHSHEVSPMSLQILKRGACPNGGGEVRFECPTIVKEHLSPVQLLDEGMIKRIRGIAYSTRVAPLMSNRLVEGARSLLNYYIPDIWVYTDHYSGKTSGNSPGWSLYLQAETDTGCRLSVEYVPDQIQEYIISSDKEGDQEWMKIPEDVGRHTAKILFDEIYKGGCIDSTNQWYMFLLMSLTSEDVSKVRVGKLNTYAIQYLRHIKQFLGVTFKITPEHDSRTVVLSCVGSGYKNISRKSN
ncbi:hypothetical protein ABK040_002378 [Willaertia magna]